MPIHPPHSAPLDSLRIGLINNMPDGAIKATERQFRTLLEEASGETPVVLTLFSLPTVPRSATALELMSLSHAGLDDLWDNRLDGLIVTGAEPTAARLNDEPYWQTLQQVFDWADANTYSTILSCLASHAAVLHRDGIARRPRKTKRFGLIPCEKTSHHPLTASIPPSFTIPHSRWNELSSAELEQNGYRILTESMDGYPDLFIKKHNSLFVYFQGHPEYETNSLMLEYRRDLGRFLEGQREEVPQQPENYFTSQAAEALAGFPENMPFNFLESCIQNSWRSTARTLYRNWLDFLLQARKAARARTFSPAGVFAPEAPAEKGPDQVPIRAGEWRMMFDAERCAHGECSAGCPAHDSSCSSSIQRPPATRRENQLLPTSISPEAGQFGPQRRNHAKGPHAAVLSESGNLAGVASRTDIGSQSGAIKQP